MHTGHPVSHMSSDNRYQELQDIPAETESDNMFVCRKCRHSWTDVSPPALCPNCNSCRWMQEKVNRRICPYCTRIWYSEGQDNICPWCGRPISLEGLEPYTCARCEYTWVIEEMGGKIPDRCPLCRTSSWRKGSAFSHFCNMCGHFWRNKVEEPLRCPSCYSEIWNIPCHHLQCMRCGHSWVSRTGTRGAASICPRCKSRYWMEPPLLTMCTACGKPFSSTRADPERTCCTCPRCRSTVREPVTRFETVLWELGDRSLILHADNGSSAVCLLSDGVPVTSVRLPDAMNYLGKTQKEFLADTDDSEMSRLADAMFVRRDDYREKILYLADLFDLDGSDAEVLSLYLDSMWPHAIALKLGITHEEVSGSFGRIMESYMESGNSADDSFRTMDPFGKTSRKRSSCP